MRRLVFLAVLSLAAALWPAVSRGAAPPALTITTVSQTDATITATIVADGLDSATPACAILRLTIDTTPVTPLSCAPQPRASAVAIIAALPAKTAASGSFTDARQIMDAMLTQLMAAGDPRASLIVITDTVSVRHSLTPDLGAVQNTVRGNLQPATVGRPVAEDQYAEAITAGLAQLHSAPAGRGRTLALIVPADQTPPLGAASLARLMQAVGAQPATESLILGVSRAADTGQTQPPDAQGWGHVAQALGGRYQPIALDDRGILPSSQATLAAELAALAHHSVELTITLDSTDLPAGANVLRADLGGGRAEQPLIIAGQDPDAQVLVEQTTPGRFRLSIAAAHPERLLQVQYLLDERPLGDPVTRAPQFALDLDAQQAEFLQQYPPGAHQLAAAVIDRRGAETRTAPQQLMIPAPPAQPFAGVRAWWWLLPLVLIGAGGWLAALWPHLRRDKVRVPGYLEHTPTRVQPGRSVGAIDDDVTRAQDGSRADNDRMRLIGPSASHGDITAELPRPATEYHPPRPAAPGRDTTEVLTPGAPAKPAQWIVELLEGAPARRYALPLADRVHALGRSDTQHPLAVAIDSRFVSGLHARLHVAQDGLQLVPAESSNSTFVGADRRLLQPGDMALLVSGDVFWLSERVKLRIIRQERSDGL